MPNEQKHNEYKGGNRAALSSIFQTYSNERIKTNKMFRDLLDYFMHIEVEPFSRDFTTTWCFPPILCYRQQERLNIVNALNLIYFLTFSTNNYCCFLLGIYLSKWWTLMTWNALKKMYESIWNDSAPLLNAVQSMLDHWDYQKDQWKHLNNEQYLIMCVMTPKKLLPKE